MQLILYKALPLKKSKSMKIKVWICCLLSEHHPPQAGKLIEHIIKYFIIKQISKEIMLSLSRQN